MDYHLLPLPLPLPRLRPLLLLFLLLLLLLLFSTATADDADVILKLAVSLEPLPPGWSTLSSSGFCSWSGIKCDSSNRRVTSISLSKRGLSGTLPPDLPTLIDLQSLSLQSNQLSGSLPSFANNSNLRTLNLDNNNFTFVPTGFFAGLTSLQTFSIGSNPNLSPWQLPDDLAQCTALMNLMAGEANLFGSIPDIFGSLPSLQDVRLGYNNLTGSLPPSMANSGIQNLWLNNQQIGLSGSIGVLSNMIQLSQVWLHKNQFTGPIPDLSGCKNIYDLQLRDNQLTGIVPESLVSLPNLVNVSLSNNKLQGPVPVFPRSVTNVVNDDGNHYCAEAGKPCDRQVNILLHIAEDFGYPATLSDAWTGNDACDGWPFVTCDSLRKNVITVNLAKQKLPGTISPAFSNLTSLQRLLLGDNNLTGSIPRSLTGLANLQVLDVSNNDLSGKVPEFSSSVRLITTPGNAKLGTETGSGGSSGPGATGPSGSSSQKIAGGKIAAIIVIIIITCVALVAFVFWKYKKRHHEFGKEKKQTTGVPSTNNGRIGGANGYDGIISDLYNQNRVSDDDRKFFEGGNVPVPIELLQQVTDNFSKDNIIGRGGFGVVYKGELHDGTKIAVKRMEATLAGNKGLNEFQAEIAVLTKVRHRHLVALLGYCINGNERLLVYEYMPRGTLGQHLFKGQHHGYQPLSWKQRVTIALDVARGVEYLHSLAQRSFIHRDLKPSNILLGDDMRAKVADFGLVKNAPDGKYSVETRLAGTFGYLAPEYAATGRVTTKVDVFAFGVVLMEMITGRKALDDNLPDDMAHLVSFFRRIVMSRENIIKAIDETLNPDEETLASICRVAELAGHCTARDPQQRPDMGHAVGVLAPLIDQWRPASQEEQEEEENFGIDLNMTLPQALQRWQADEGSSTTFSEQSYQSSAPSKPPGFADTFTLHDGR